MKWSDLKPGMVVELTNGWRCVVFKEEVESNKRAVKAGLMLRHTEEDTGCMHIEPTTITAGYYNDMLHPVHGYAIDKVYIGDMYGLNPRGDDLELIWKREPHIEVTISIPNSDIPDIKSHWSTSESAFVKDLMQKLIDEIPEGIDEYLDRRRTTV